MKKQTSKPTENTGANKAYARVRAKIARMRKKLYRACHPHRRSIVVALDDLHSWIGNHDLRNRRKGGLGRK